MQKPREALTDASKSIERESKTDNEHTVAVLCQRHGFVLLYHFFVVVVVVVVF